MIIFHRLYFQMEFLAKWIRLYMIKIPLTLHPFNFMIHPTLVLLLSLFIWNISRNSTFRCCWNAVISKLFCCQYVNFQQSAIISTAENLDPENICCRVTFSLFKFFSFLFPCNYERIMFFLTFRKYPISQLKIRERNDCRITFLVWKCETSMVEKCISSEFLFIRLFYWTFSCFVSKTTCIWKCHFTPFFFFSFEL